MPSPFFPPLEPFRTGRLPVSDGHELYWEQVGRPEGTPIIILHGGPGSGCSAKYRQLFDPERYCITLMDQRGAGRSTPHLQLAGNTTSSLIEDIEVLRQELGIERWIAFGPSWGSTLALAYAQAYPNSVSGLVVEAVFLGTDEELAWWHDSAGAPRFFPDAWADFIAPVPQDARSSAARVLDWYLDAMRAEQADDYAILKQLADPAVSIETLRQSALYRWTEFEERLSYLDVTAREARDGFAVRGWEYVAAHSLIEAHYFKHKCFLKPDQLIREADTLADIPMAILHSRYDMVCPPRSAFRLAAACPHADFQLVALNGHGMTDASQLALNGIMERLDKRLG
ncbi:prolyl aminopeptidase [Maricaulis sp.]|uniref:prolyl aminopeptidase n=1 Tax=Maricaulis sp. TaxID=1486257 RepID=UPI00261D5E51|nr:prolyl aminopeptidase [Maricaulis sp.]